MDLSQRLDEMELAIHKPSFRKGTGRANEVNYWVFDYPPEKELEVRERVEYLKNKNDRGDDDFELVVFDLYDIIIDFLEKKNFMEKCYDFEKKRGIERIVKAVTNSMKVNDDDSLIVQYIKEHTLSPVPASVRSTGCLTAASRTASRHWFICTATRRIPSATCVSTTCTRCSECMSPRSTECRI